LRWLSTAGFYAASSGASEGSAAPRRLDTMCRSIKTLRPPYAEAVTDADMRAAALQYVRKISGFRAPAARNSAAFDQAVEEIAAATARLLDALEVRAPAQAG
jgi:hypothetical protein